MIEITNTGDGNQLEMHLTGQVTQIDYDTVLIPAIEAALKEHDGMRVLVVVEPSFAGYDTGALWADSKLGLTYWSGFERLAVVADKGWIAMGARAFAPVMPCPVKVFGSVEIDEARRWLRESLGAVHVRDLGGNALMVQLLGRPDAGDFEQASGNMDALLRDHDGFHLLLDLREFDGWQGLAALGDHLKLVRDHRHIPTRVAIVGDKDWQKLAQKVLRLFIDADTRYFAEDDFDDARAFLG